jgi:hypothetical protein
VTRGYDFDHLHRWLRSRNITPHIARKGIKSSHMAGPPPLDCRENRRLAVRPCRLHRRYESKTAHFLAFAGIAATLICHRRPDDLSRR